MPHKVLSTWADFYRDRVNESYFKHIQTKYAPFIQEVLKEIRPAMRVVESGCGIGSITKALMKVQPQVEYCVQDNDPQMLALTYENIRPSQDKLKYLVGDIRRECWWGEIVHSHGVLEHFSDDEIRQIIARQKDQYEVLIHYVPGYLYGTPSFGDERLLTPENWHEICKPDDIIEFNDGYDLILKWRVK